MASVSKEVGAAIFLPDEIVVRIFNKTDLKTLFNCKRVSRGFYQIACQVDTITFNAPSRWKTDNMEFCSNHVYSFGVLKHHDKNLYRSRAGWRFDRVVHGLIKSMTKFTRLRSLNIELPSKSSFKGLQFTEWKVFVARNRIDSFVFLSSTSIHDTKGSLYFWTYPYIETKCMDDAYVRYLMLFGLARECPFLEKISIADPCKRGRISVSGAKLSEVIKLFSAHPPEVYEFCRKIRAEESRCRIHWLDLPVAGLVMKGVELTLYKDVDLPSGYTYDGFININDEGDFKDKEEAAAYSEAVMEIFKKHGDEICRPGIVCYNDFTTICKQYRKIDI